MKIWYNVDLYFSHAYFSFSHSHGISFSLHLSHLLIQLLQQKNHPSLTVATRSFVCTSGVLIFCFIRKTQKSGP